LFGFGKGVEFSVVGGMDDVDDMDNMDDVDGKKQNLFP